MERPPLLYDLATLQRRANQRYGFSAQYTLQIAQALYEKHKLISYPRTDARYITPDQVPHLPPIVDALGKLPVYQPFCQQIRSSPIKPGKRVVNAAEVGDHHAILPTGRVPSSSGLGLDEKRLFDLIARRFLAALSADALFDVSTLIVDITPKPGVALPEGVTSPLKFRARGKICTQEGWRAVDPPAASRVARKSRYRISEFFFGGLVGFLDAWLLRHGRVGRALMGPGNALSPSQGDRQRRVHTDASAGTSLAASIKALRRTTTRRTTRRTSGPS